MSENLENTMELEQVPALAPVEVSYQTKAEDLEYGLNVYDVKSGLARRKQFQAFAIVLVSFMFIDQLVADPTRILGWVMLALCAGVFAFIWKYPAYMNRKLAVNKAQSAPEYRLVIYPGSIHVEASGGSYEVTYEPGVFAYQCPGRLVINYDKTRLLVLPQNQVDEDAWERIKELLKAGLDDQYQVYSDPVKKKSPFKKS
ncbi:hypothetical protein [Youxingia wuxianensis]|uniref:YcxB-like protein domain-containing protein n=1 Tax=Youxingia wuxianensis TaxID=2763678 RepID=A0A926ETP9_9FIRM|nr:hypothetical protein [Youxingia wuxianensis]MBC8586309.1 hypothetical protein [Youxingia wuxianensis]